MTQLVIVFVFTILTIVKSYTIINRVEDSISNALIKGRGSDNPDVYLTTLQIIARHGYPAESHTIQSSDGFLLTLHRIPYAKNNKTDNRPVIFVQHGVLGSSADWVLQGNNSLAFVLSDAGYDVWLGNARGNTYSRGHVKYTPKQAEFWDFSFHEMGTLDLPVIFDFIQNKTDQIGNITYVGHSMGTTMFFIYASTHKNANDTVRMMVALAPVAFLTDVRSPIKYLAPWSNDIEWLAKYLGINDFLPSSKILKYLADVGCDKGTKEMNLCEDIIFLFCGFDKEEFNGDILLSVLNHEPAGSSTKTVIHYAQQIKSGGLFCEYNYGPEENMRRYGTKSPPNYNITNIQVPIYLMSAENDWLAGPVLFFRLEQPHGLGDIYLAWQKGSGNYLATTGYDSTIKIFDRYGQLFSTIHLQGYCCGFGWDTDGDLLAVISENSSQLILWDANQDKKQYIDVGIRDTLSCLFWSKTAPIIAVGTAKGNLSIYNHNTSKRIPIIGKHSKRITCGSWNSENLLALGSEDRTLSINNADGDTLRVITLRYEPADIQFSEMKLDERVGGENTISVIVGKRTLYLYNLLDPENPIELAFQQHYGHIITYKWFGDGYILLGFSAGYFIAISTHIKEVGQELFQVRNHKNSLTDVAISFAINKVASCGDNTVKIHDISNLQETSSVLSLNQETGLEKIAWSEDGQLLAVCTQNGSVNVYLSQLPTLTAVYGSKIAMLSSLMEVALYNYSPEKVKLIPATISTETEPGFLSVGPYHMAVGMNNRAWFYDLTRPQPGPEKQPLLIRDREYLGAVVSMRLNAEYASVLYDGKIHLHMIEQPEVSSEDRESKIFPESGTQNIVITCHCLTNEFLVYGTDVGHIYYFYVEDWAFATEFRHLSGIREIFVDATGTRLVFVDDKSHGYVYNPVSNEVISISDLPNKVSRVIWETNLADRNVFIVYDEQDIYTYIYIKQSIYGSTVEKVGKTKLVSQQIPLLLYAGEVTLGTTGGQLTQMTLATHDSFTQTITLKENSTSDVNLTKQLLLHRFTEAWKTCQQLYSKECWVQLAEKALQHLDIDLAMRVYCHIEDVAMVWALKEISDLEEYKLLCGYVSLYLHDYERAEEWFLKSNKPTAALQMRRDLLQWDQALTLAKKLDPSQIPAIAREYAQQLEFTGNYPEALVHYEKGLSDASNQDHITQCKSGVARMSIRVGNYKHGINLALELNNKQLLKDCADILEHKKQTHDAAILYERAQLFDKAALAYIKLRNWHKVGELISNVSSNKIHLQYAKAKEQEGKFDEAANAYMLGKDYDSVIRLQLEFLNNPEAAVELVQETKSIEGAKLVARFFQRLNDYPSAIRFLVLSRCHEEAFELARKHGKLPLYGEVLVNSLSPEETRPQDFRSLVMYFENERNFLLAGKYSFHARDYQKAMKHLLRAAKSNSDENEALTTAIDVVASSNDESLGKQLVEFLLGEIDGMPKDPKYLFRLYMARKQFTEAAKTAVIIASEEQINGNYRNAHDVLFSMYQELRRNRIRVPNEMLANLTLLHSYILVRLHVRRGDHIKGARMLIRVANNISKFPSHIVPILTSAVIECHRAGLKYSAFTFATILMRPENRSQIDPKYAKKIEAVVRRPPKQSKDGEGADPVEPLTPCPYCEYKLPETEMSCSQCKNNLPFCIATGRHIITTDLTACPECDFPAIWTEFISILESDDTCPMCSEKVDSRRLTKIEDSKPYLSTDY